MSDGTSSNWPHRILYVQNGADNYLNLQSLVSIQELIQPINVVGGCHGHENNQIYEIS
jgi:hypothetical protein